MAKQLVSMGIGADLGYPEVDTGDYLNFSFLKKWAKEQGVNLGAADRRLIKQWSTYNFFVTDEFDKQLLKQARDIIFNNAGKIPSRELAVQLREGVKNWGHGHISTIVRTNTARAYNNGRMDEFEKAGDSIEAYQYSSILDDRTTEYCQIHNGQVVSASGKNFGSAQPPKHYQCRSMLEPIFVGEEWTETWTEFPKPQQGFGS